MPRKEISRNSGIKTGLCGFPLGSSTLNQIFSMMQIFEKSWEHGKDLSTCFVDLEKAYFRHYWDKPQKVLQEYGVNGQLLLAITSFHCRPEVCIRGNSKQSKSFYVGIGLRQGSILSPFLYIFYMIGSTNTSNLRCVPQLEIAKSVCCYWLMIWFCFL